MTIISPIEWCSQWQHFYLTHSDFFSIYRRNSTDFTSCLSKGFETLGRIISASYLETIPSLVERSSSTESAVKSRHYGWQQGGKIQLYVFAVAAEIGLCVVAYLRIEVDDEDRVSFVMCKTRVAPTKTTTIPKLELQGALHASAIKISIFL